MLRYRYFLSLMSNFQNHIFNHHYAQQYQNKCTVTLTIESFLK